MFRSGFGKTEWFKDYDKWPLESAPEMVVIPAGRFLMGSPENEPQREPEGGRSTR
jgi:formylglycine-generating enzyme required for sulfatase activity